MSTNCSVKLLLKDEILKSNKTNNAIHLYRIFPQYIKYSVYMNHNCYVAYIKLNLNKYVQTVVKHSKPTGISIA
jgi:hypothetical protein